MSAELTEPFEASFVSAERMYAERLSTSDLAFLRAAQKQQESAKTVMDFTLGQLGARYELREGDQITPDGEIVRKQ